MGLLVTRTFSIRISTHPGNLVIPWICLFLGYSQPAGLLITRMDRLVSHFISSCGFFHPAILIIQLVSSCRSSHLAVVIFPLVLSCGVLALWSLFSSGKFFHPTGVLISWVVSSCGFAYLKSLFNFKLWSLLSHYSRFGNL